MVLPHVHCGSCCVCVVPLCHRLLILFVCFDGLLYLVLGSTYSNENSSAQRRSSDAARRNNFSLQEISFDFLSCLGYGHISPATDIGRAITIVYAIIGIPMFLTLLADFGKLLTRNMKFLWAYVRRLYYTGSLRRVRKQAQVQVNSLLSVLYLCIACC